MLSAFGRNSKGGRGMKKLFYSGGGRKKRKRKLSGGLWRSLGAGSGQPRSNYWFKECIWLSAVGNRQKKKRKTGKYGPSPDHPGLVATEVVGQSPIITGGLVIVHLYT